MKEYFKWLITNTKIKKATFRLFWFFMYLTFLFLIIREAIRDTPKALFLLPFIGAMMYYQWRHFKTEKNKNK